MLRVHDFTLIEINRIKNNANFTRMEDKLFDLRNNETSLEMCAEIMNCSVSTVKRINKSMMSKINRVM